MSCHACWPVGGLIALGGVLAQVPPQPPPPEAPPAQTTPARSGAEILGRPGIRTRYADPSAPAPSSGGAGLADPSPPDPPLTVPINESVDFAPTMEQGPFQRPTIRGLFRWDLEGPVTP